MADHESYQVHRNSHVNCKKIGNYSIFSREFRRCGETALSDAEESKTVSLSCENHFLPEVTNCNFLTVSTIITRMLDLVLHENDIHKVSCNSLNVITVERFNEASKPFSQILLPEILRFKTHH